MKLFSAVLVLTQFIASTDAFGNSFQRSSISCTQNASFGASRPFGIRTTALHMVAEAIEGDVEEADDKMQKSVESVKKNLASIRTGRANANLLDRVMVSYYGADTPLNQLAGVSVTSAQQLTVDPYDKTCIGDIEKAIMEADLGINPNNDGTVIRINIPSLTEERRKELLKQCKSLGEEGKVGVRNVRKAGVAKIKKLEKDSAIGKDESLDGLDEIQKLTDQYNKEIEAIVAAKEKEVMTI
eukprot:CAMPEP_0195527458 /NCGR_PEP_ID=MMETSP0794_2-20130614/29148_1 /TAXON_ID=515487 /ORGANISM="Stephanopyxis turris, Strain CCMP 815" /LENGTH=240 /DNA_ID=CAMNT_0040658361 /DNA_START=41 /DNA_END=763 /DNA_ORIENTATION=-